MGLEVDDDDAAVRLVFVFVVVVVIFVVAIAVATGGRRWPIITIERELQTRTVGVVLIGLLAAPQLVYDESVEHSPLS
jgi:hypothetical protein